MSIQLRQDAETLIRTARPCPAERRQTGPRDAVPGDTLNRVIAFYGSRPRQNPAANVGPLRPYDMHPVPS